VEAGLFVIIPESVDNGHPGYLMRADTNELAAEWVAGARPAFFGLAGFASSGREEAPWTSIARSSVE